jgi:hypothetical protein
MLWEIICNIKRHMPRKYLSFFFLSKCDPLTPEQEDRVEDGSHFPAFNDDLPGWFSVKNEDGMRILYTSVS